MYFFKRFSVFSSRNLSQTSGWRMFFSESPMRLVCTLCVSRSVSYTHLTALEVFDDLLHKPKMERNDLELMIDKITVYEDHLEVHLQLSLIHI